MDPEQPPSMAETISETLVRFDYIKSNFFRVIKLDGVLGDLTPAGEIHMAVFTERQAIPQSTGHELRDGGLLGPVVERTGRAAYVREIDIDIFMTIERAESLVDWLQTQISKSKAETLVGDVK